MSSWIVSTIRIILDDLAPYQDGRLIPVESFSSSLELMYRELLIQESLHGLTVLEREGCELIRHSMATFRIMHMKAKCRGIYQMHNHPLERISLDVQDI